MNRTPDIHTEPDWQNPLLGCAIFPTFARGARVYTEEVAGSNPAPPTAVFRRFFHRRRHDSEGVGWNQCTTYQSNAAAASAMNRGE
jgi:hypothetical protein